MITFQNIKDNEDIKTYVKAADSALAALGYTEHSFAHVIHVAKESEKILEALAYPKRTCELASIAGYLHDIGNIVNRVDHSQSGAVMAFRLLDKMGMPAEEIAAVVSAIGNHDEGTGVPVNPIAAALIIADKSDVRRSRVRNSDPSAFDIHDRVNYSTVESALEITPESKEICLKLTIDTKISAIMDYFEIFIGRMLLCRKAAEYLGLSFNLNINGQPFMR